MSNTRRQKNGGPLRQERYASAPELNDGLKASAVARKCSLLPDPSHKEIALYLQAASMQPGGLTAFTSDFLKRYSDRIGSKSMRGKSALKTFDAAMVRTVRGELGLSSYPLKGETASIDPWGWELDKVRKEAWEDSYDPEYVDKCMEEVRAEYKKKAAQFPESYPAQDFIDYCTDRAEENLESWLIDFCLNPKTTFNAGPNWFYELEQSLKDYMRDRREDVTAGQIVTSIGEQINDALEYAWDEKVLVHINGVARMGKTHQVKQWCATWPGRVRYIQAPAGNDDVSFFRAIARALGSAAGSAMKTTQMKRQIEDTIQDAGLMLIFDEGHFLFPQSKDVRNYPRRINWILTEVVNKGIPAAIVSTPQFDTTQKIIVNGSGWASEQLDGRIAYRLDLPAILPPEDLTAIARHYLPESSAEVLEFLSAYARRSGKYLAGLEAVSKRARFLARKAGHTVPSSTEIQDAMIQVDPSIAEIFNTEESPTECKAPAKRMQGARRQSAQTVQTEKKTDSVVA